jgi:hypothetical protein
VRGAVDPLHVQMASSLKATAWAKAGWAKLALVALVGHKIFQS